MVVFARGTNEIPTLGEVVGPELQVALQAALESTNKSLTFTGVHYSATILGYLQGGAATGSVEMARQLTLAANLCPKAAIVAVGYSQGAQLVHNSMRFLASVVSERIKAVVLFGDPDNGQALQGIDVSRVQTICHVGDPICEGGNLLQILLMDAQHLNYKVDVPGTVDFIVARV
ncbi:cutinase [Mycena rebaudengoi]|nr:cutinase [Mycena rebaudengoi]